jgi:hypothetical protein
MKIVAKYTILSLLFHLDLASEFFYFILVKIDLDRVRVFTYLAYTAKRCTVYMCPFFDQKS